MESRFTEILCVIIMFVYTVFLTPNSVADPEGGPWVPWNPPFKENVLCCLLANYLLI